MQTSFERKDWHRLTAMKQDIFPLTIHYQHTPAWFVLLILTVTFPMGQNMLLQHVGLFFLINQPAANLNHEQSQT